ncbi:MAG: DNA polymerase III subunit gamma/tau [Desulfobacteraceae bacterium]|nr:DNA polymerase III subunit gamma/tau [Desulfobacteraceae bacterium]
MSYQVLALKYRPHTFNEVVGQSHVTRTLENAIVADRVAHAMLFTGPRGTGKTTIARIMAKAMNCRTGPTPTPCNTCKTCKDIIEGHCSDVFEIDGASNNSVDQIRDLRENVTYMPATSPYKIYIIDEVHMLSTAAFNALLKTLEEPPGHVLFIFATTEVHKIPATILSRCQRHDLGRVNLEQISDHLETLCAREGFTIKRESLDLISLEADGSIRDSLSLLDRILAACPDKLIDHDKVVDNLGVMDRKVMHDISSAIFSKDGAALIHIVETVNDSGLDLKKFFSNIILHFRNLNVIKLCGQDNTAINLTNAEKEKLAQAVYELPPNYLGMLLQLLLNEESLVKFSSHTKTAVEMVLLKLIQINPGAQLDLVINKLDLLARQIDSKLTKQELTDSSPPRQEMAPPGMPLSQPALETPPPMVSTKTALAVGAQVPPLQTKESQTSYTPMETVPIKTAPIEAAPMETTSIEDAPKTWPNFLKLIEKKLPFIFVLLSKGQIDDSKENAIQVKLYSCSAFNKTRLNTKKDELKSLCKNFLGKKLEIAIISENESIIGTSKEKNNLKMAALNHPLVLDAQRIFDGEIINY